MRTFLVLIALALSSCQQQEPAPPAPDRPGTEVPLTTVAFAGKGRDRACRSDGGKRMGVITFAPSGDTNCAVSGSVEPGQGGTSALVPDGDRSCRIHLTEGDDGRTIVLGEPSGSCAYYCGPGASFAGAEFRKDENGPPATDLAGDPLC